MGKAREKYLHLPLQRGGGGVSDRGLRSKIFGIKGGTKVRTFCGGSVLVEKMHTPDTKKNYFSKNCLVVLRIKCLLLG